MDVWSWICELPSSEEWSISSSLVFPLASSKPGPINTSSSSTLSIQLTAEKSSGSNLSEPSVTFSVCSLGVHPSKSTTEVSTLWVSEACPLYSEKQFLPLVLQLLQEIISRSPNGHESTCPRSQLQKLNSEPVSWIMDSHSPESFSRFFNLIFLTRLFWICVWDAPSEVGSLYFHSLLAPNLETFSCKHAPVLRAFFVSAGTDVELCVTRTFGYMVAKWLILREVTLVGAGLKSITPLPSDRGCSYAMESHGLWILKGYAPVKAMNCLWSDGPKNQYPMIEAKESVLKYALAHQQLEAVIQMEYTVGFYDGYIQVHARVDNIRLHVVKLGFKNKEGNNFLDEKYFPSRARVWVGPEMGANYLAGLSLGRSTDNMEREVEVQKVLKGDFGKSKTPEVKAMARMTTKTKIKNWRWDQDVEGNAAIFDAVLCDNTTGIEIATWKPPTGSGGANQLASNFARRKNAASRAFTKSGAVIFADEECKNGVRWRLSKEMEGSVLKWRIGGLTAGQMTNSPTASQLTCTGDSKMMCLPTTTSTTAFQLICSEETKFLKCYCKLNAKLRVSRTPRNQFRLFYNCASNSLDNQCGFFQWADESLPTGDKHLDDINCISDECMRLQERIDQIREEHHQERIAWSMEKKKKQKYKSGGFRVKDTTAEMGIMRHYREKTNYNYEHMQEY